jgi:MscS family membrane protein
MIPHLPLLFGVSTAQLVIAFLTIAAGFTGAWLAMVVLGRLRAESQDRPFRASLLQAAEDPARWALITLGTFAALETLPLPRAPLDLRHLVETMMLAASLAFAIWFGLGLVDAVADLWARRAALTETPFDDTLVPVARKSAKVFLVVAGSVMIVQNLGYSVGSLLAGFGIGGAALALASKDTIANVFGSVVIFLDRPFYVGDWIEIGEQEGTVEEVGLRVTRVRTFANSLITIPNAQLTTMSINNWSRMRKRRIMLTLGLTYDTTPAQLTRAVAAIRQVLRDDPRICQDFSLVNFTDLGAHSLDIFVYAFTTTTNWAEHLQIREDVLLAFMTAIADLGLQFAFPTQTLHVAALEKLVPSAVPQAMSKQLPG